MTKKKWCGRKSNLSSFHSKFIFWLGIQNAKTFMGRSEEWTWRVKNDIQVIVIVALLLLLARPPSIHSSTWAKSSIANCFCLDQLCGRARQKRPHRWVGWLAAWLPACLPWLVTQPTNYVCHATGNGASLVAARLLFPSSVQDEHRRAGEGWLPGSFLRWLDGVETTSECKTGWNGTMRVPFRCLAHSLTPPPPQSTWFISAAFLLTWHIPRNNNIPVGAVQWVAQNKYSRRRCRAASTFYN